MNLRIAKILIIILSIFGSLIVGLLVYALFIKKHLILDGSTKLKNTIFYEPLKNMGILPQRLSIKQWLISLFKKKNAVGGILDYFELK